jgi:Zn-dependent protease
LASRLFLYTAVLVNLILAIFNLIPIPPLDGSRILSGLLSYRCAYYFSRLEPYGFLILCLLLWMGLFSKFILPLAFKIAASLCRGDYFWIQ